MRQLLWEPNERDPEFVQKFKAHAAVIAELKARISELRERVKYFNLPYLSLPTATSKDVALQVFINMNTNSKPLSLYDIIVAEVESIAQRSPTIWSRNWWNLALKRCAMGMSATSYWPHPLCFKKSCPIIAA